MILNREGVFMSLENNQFSDVEKSHIKNSKFLTSFQRKMLLKNLQSTLPPEYRHRIEIMLLADEGKSLTQISQTLGFSYHMVRYWVGMAKAGLAHQWQEQPIGRPKSINQQYLDRLKELVCHSPREYGYSFQNWTAECLSKHLARELGIEITKRHISRLLKQMGLSTHHINNQIKPEIDNTQDAEITITELPLSPGNNCQWSLNFINLKH